MISAYQRPLGDLAEEKLVHFDRLCKSISLRAREEYDGLILVSARIGHRVVFKIRVGAPSDVRAELQEAFECAMRILADEEAKPP